MAEKLNNFTDPVCGTYDGEDRIFNVPFAASQALARRGGKAVDCPLFGNYKAATALSENLAGFLEVDAIGVTGGHPATVSEGDLLPVNFGINKTCVFPTSNRAALSSDIGKSFDIIVASNVQYVNMNASTKGILKITEVLDEAGNFVACGIPTSKRHGNL
jgi:hypothetical protein